MNYIFYTQFPDGETEVQSMERPLKAHNKPRRDRKAGNPSLSISHIDTVA